MSQTAFCLFAAVMLAAGVTSCAGRPCQCTCVMPSCATMAQAAPNASTPAAASGASASPPAALSSKPLLVWDGEGTGAQAKGWASCQKEKSCVRSLEVKPGAGHNGSTGLEFKAKGSEWMGFGWNWFGWHPASAGTDISKHKSLDFWIRVSGAAGKKPEADSVMVSLQSSSKGGNDETAQLPINDYAPGFTDGQWRKVSVPLEALRRGKGASFDTSKAWLIAIGAWNEGEREYTIQLDEIEFS
jgi:hypothetical protein